MQNILKLRNDFTDGQIKRYRNLLNETRRDIIARISEVPQFEAAYLGTMRTAVDNAMDRLEREATADLQNTVVKNFTFGTDALPDAITATGRFVGFPSIAPSLVKVITDFSADLIVGLTDEKRKAINSEIARGILMGARPRQVIDRIGRNLTDPSIFRNTRYRGETIYRTEAMRAYGMAAEARMRDAAALGLLVTAKWEAIVDNRTCAACLALNGSEFKVTEKGLVGGVGIPLHPNCRCHYVESVSYKEDYELQKKKAIGEYETDILNETGNNWEACYAINDEVFHKRGEQSQIDFRVSEVEKLKKMRVFTHNHPSSGSFSPQDLRLTIDTNLKEMRAIAPHSRYGNVTYYIRRTGKDWGTSPQAFFAVYQHEDQIQRDMFWPKVSSGELSKEKANLIHHDEVWKRVAKLLGWKYGHRKR